MSFYQMTQFVMTIIASDRALKKCNNGLPGSPILATVIPKIMLKITRPKVFALVETPVEMSQSYNEVTENFNQFTNLIIIFNLKSYHFCLLDTSIRFYPGKIKVCY